MPSHSILRDGPLCKSALEDARAVPIMDVARALKLRRIGQEHVGACPVCGGHDRFSINPTKSVWNCRRCGRGGDVIDLVMHVDGLDFAGAVERLVGPSARAEVRQQTAPAAAAARIDYSAEAARRQQEAAGIWREAADPTGTPVEAYLTRRRVALPDGAAGGTVRFHPACKFGMGRTPCMVALVRNIQTDAPQAIHRTAIDLAGRKVSVGGHDRLGLGPVGGGAVKLTSDTEVTTCLGVGEGIETTLSMRSIPEFGASPVWSLLSAGGVAGFPVLPGIECVWIAVDHDEAGQRAAATCARRWTEAGHDAFRVRPAMPGDDLNDLIRRA